MIKITEKQNMVASFTILALIVSFVIMAFTSCSEAGANTTVQHDMSKKKVRLQHLVRQEVIVRYVDTLYREGDLVNLNGERFTIIK